MKIEQRGITITEIPGMKSITVEHGPYIGVHVVIDSDFTYSDMHGKVMPQSYGLTEARELRDALSAAIEHAERMSAPVESPSTFAVGQALDGTEDLPIGTVIQDCDDDRWYVKQDGKLRLFSAPGYKGIYALSEVVAKSGPLTIVSLP